MLKKSITKEIELATENINKKLKETSKVIELKIQKTKSRISNLTDGMIDGVFDKETYLDKKNQLVHELNKLEEDLRNCSNTSRDNTNKIKKLEQAASLYWLYMLADESKKRLLLKKATSNFCSVNGIVCLTTNPVLDGSVFEPVVHVGGPDRTWTHYLLSASEAL